MSGSFTHCKQAVTLSCVFYVEKGINHYHLPLLTAKLVRMADTIPAGTPVIIAQVQKIPIYIYMWQQLYSK